MSKKTRLTSMVERHLLPKRAIYFAGAEQKKDEQENSIEAQRTGRAKEAFEKYLGKTPEQAKNIIVDGDEKFGKVIDDLIENTQGKVMTTLHSVALNKLGGNKKSLEQKVTQKAEKDFKKFTEGMKLSNALRRRHMENSMALLHTKGEIYGNIISSLGGGIEEIDHKLTKIEEARQALGFFRRSKIRMPKDLQVRVERMKEVHKNASELKQENEDQQGGKEQRMKNIEQVDGMIKNIVLSQKPDMAGPLQKAMREAVLAGKMNEFEAVIASSGVSKMEAKTCKDLIQYLKSGSTLANISGGYIGSFRKQDVEDYFIKNQVERGELNRDNDSPYERAKRLDTLPVGQEVMIGADKYYVTSKSPKNGVVMKAAEGDGLAFVDWTDEKQPVVTIKNGDVLKTQELKAEKTPEEESANVLAVEFKTEDIQKTSPKDIVDVSVPTPEELQEQFEMSPSEVTSS